MKYLSSLLLIATAATAGAQYTNASAPFNLILSSPDSLAGSALIACHIGAAIEGLCLASALNITTPSTFQHNTSNTAISSTSSSSSSSSSSLGAPGYLTYLLVGGNFNLSSPLALAYRPTSNVAQALFQPGVDASTTVVAFDNDDRLHIQSFIDDTVDPIVAGNPAPYYNWLLCDTYFNGYRYRALAWLVGVLDTPQNPTCVTVGVERVFV